jgi:hypothetical protein
VKRILVCLLALLPLVGCRATPYARELEDTMLVQVLGVDWTDDGVTLTAVSDPGQGGGETCLLAAWGRDLAQAQAALKGAGEEYVSLTHVTQLVVGADADVTAVLEAALVEPDLGQGATVWIAAEGTANQLLEGAGGGAKRLSSVELNGGVTPVTVLQGRMHLAEDGWVELPTLAVTGETLVAAGSQRVEEGTDGG